MVVLDVAQRLEELLHRGCLQFAGAHLSLLYEVFDLRLLGLCNGILVSIRGVGCVCRANGIAEQRGRGDNAVCHLHLRYIECLFANFGIEGQVKFALLHGRHVVERVAHGVTAANLVGDFHLGTLQPAPWPVRSRSEAQV